MWRVCESSNSSNVAALKVVDVPTLLSTGVDSVQLEKGGTDDESTMISDIVQRTRPAEDHEYTFDFAIVDEAHLLKNDGALWGIGAALIGHASRRFLAVTGTPFNNSYGDIAALIRYGLCGNQPVRRMHPTTLHEVISRR